MTAVATNSNEHVVPQGARITSRPGAASVILSGRVDVTIGGTRVATLGPGELIAGPLMAGAATRDGAAAAMSEVERPTSEPVVTAITAVAVRELEPRHVVELLHHPLVAAALLRVLAGTADTAAGSRGGTDGRSA